MNSLFNIRFLTTTRQKRIQQSNMGSDDAYLLTASEALAKIRAGGMTIEGYVRSLLRRIDVRDVDVGAWAYIDKQYILQQARVLDKVPMSKRGPLHGMPIAIKDVIYTKGESSLGYHVLWHMACVTILACWISREARLVLDGSIHRCCHSFSRDQFPLSKGRLVGSILI
jgi:hypothetical protein